MSKQLHLAKHLSLSLDAVTRKPLLTKAEKLERQRALARKWRAQNREKLRTYFRDYRLAHPELTDKQARYYQANLSKWRARPPENARRRARNATKRGHLNAVHRAWRTKNKPRALATSARSRAKHRDAQRQRDRVYRQQKAGICNAAIAKAKAKKPDLYRQIAVQSALKRRARKKAAIVERVSVRRIVVRDGSICHLCAKVAEPQHRSLDHLIPVVRGGAHAEWNLMTAHLSCNKRRGTKRILREETKQAAEAYIAARLTALSEVA